MKLTKEIKTAILAISSILLFIWGYSFLKGSDLLSNYKKVFVEYDNVEGLLPSSPVSLNGLTIGKVKSIDLLESGKLLVELQINSDFKITEKSVAQVYAPSPIGGKQIAIIINKNSTKSIESGDYLVSASKLGVIDGVLGQLDPIKIKVEKLMDNANLMLQNVNQLLNAETKNNIQTGLDNLNETLEQFKLASTQVNSMLSENKSKLNTTLSNVDVASKNFAKISDSLSKTEINKTIKTLENTLSNVNVLMKNLNDGKGSMGKLLKDDALYTNFSKTSKELELLLQDVRLYPTRYVNVSLFGKKNKPYAAPKPTDTIK